MGKVDREQRFFCIFCCKHIKNKDASSGPSFPENEERDVLKGFLKLLERYFGTHLKPDLVNFLGEDAGGVYGVVGGLEDGRLKVGACQLCGTVLTACGKLYHEIKCVELEIHGKVETLLRVMKEAGRVPSRMKGIKEGCGEGGNTNADVEEVERKYRSFLGFRKDLIETCSRGLSKIPPRVRLEKLTTSNGVESSTVQKLECDEDLVCIMTGWIMTFAAVVVLQLSSEISGGASNGKDQSRGHDLQFVDELDYFRYHNDQDDGTTIFPQNQELPSHHSNDLPTPLPDFESDFNGDGDAQGVDISCQLTVLQSCQDEIGQKGDSVRSDELFFDDHASISSHDSETSSDNHDVKKPPPRMDNDEMDIENMKIDEETRNEPQCDKEAEMENGTSETRLQSQPDITVAVKQEKTPTAQIANKKFSCDFCCKSYSCKQILNMHARKLHPESRKTLPQQTGTFFCKICKKDYPNYSGYWEHRNNFMHRLKLKMTNKRSSVGFVDDTIIEKRKCNQSQRILNVAKTAGENAKLSNKPSPQLTTVSKIDSSSRSGYNLRRKRPSMKKSNAVSSSDNDEDSDFSEEFNSTSNSSSSIGTSDSEGDEDFQSVKIEGAIRKKKRKTVGPFQYCRLDGCRYSTNSSKVYEQHKKLHEPGNYSCNFCTAVEENALKLSLHEIKKHSKGRQWKQNGKYCCPRCPFQATQWLFYVNHFAKFHLRFSQLTREPCEICQVQISISRQRNHFRKCHDTTGVDPAKILKCQEKDCTAFFNNKSKISFYRHNHEVHNSNTALLNSEDEDDNDNSNEELRCKVCKKEFMSAYRFQYHKRFYHKEGSNGFVSKAKPNIKKGECPVFGCRKHFKQQDILDKHGKLHGNFKCHFCDVVVTYAPDLPRHEIEHTTKTKSRVLKCSRCSYASLKQHYFITHYLETHMELTDRLHSCSICNDRFHKRQFLTIHYDSHHKATGSTAVINCNTCSAYFLQDEQLQKHATTCSSNSKPSICSQPSTPKVKPLLLKPKDLFFCTAPNCYETFRVPEHLEKHRKLHGDFKCQFCSVHKTYAFDLATHEMEEHANPIDGEIEKREKFRCPRCTYSSPTQGIYLRHFVEKHLDLDARVHSCSICEASCLSWEGIQRHSRQCHNTKGLDPSTIQKCDQCSAYFLQKIQLIQHKRNAHNNSFPESFQCATCNKFYKTMGSLKIHRHNMHGLEESKKSFEFSCGFPNCKAGFETSDELEWHKSRCRFRREGTKWQKNRENLTCEKCGKVCKGVTALQWHMRATHRLGKPKEFKCNLCGKIFTTKAVLQKHEQFHKSPDEWEFMCAICSKKCVDKWKLELHMNTHSKAKPFVCEVCGQKYAHRHNLRNHVNSKHKDEGITDIPKIKNQKNFVSRKGKKLARGIAFSLTHEKDKQS